MKEGEDGVSALLTSLRGVVLVYGAVGTACGS